MLGADVAAVGKCGVVEEAGAVGFHGGFQFIDEAGQERNDDAPGDDATVLPEQTLSPSRSFGKTGSPFGFTAGEVDINWFDAQLPALMSKLGIQPHTFPIFLTYDVYLTQGGGCCIGGYHSSEGSVSNPQSYAEATYVDHPGAFSQDVSALSHEVGEWADDPLTVNYNGNNTPCGILEVGDPLEGNPNYGGYPYSLHGFTYNAHPVSLAAGRAVLRYLQEKKLVRAQLAYLDRAARRDPARAARLVVDAAEAVDDQRDQRQGELVAAAPRRHGPAEPADQGGEIFGRGGGRGGPRRVVSMND